MLKAAGGISPSSRTCADTKRFTRAKKKALRAMKSKNTNHSVMSSALPTIPPSLRAWRAELTRRIFFSSLRWSILAQTTRGLYSNVAQRIWPPLYNSFSSSLVFFFVSFFLCARQRLIPWPALFFLSTFYLWWLSASVHVPRARRTGGTCTGVDNYLWCLICYDHRGAGGFFLVYSRMDVGFTFTLFPR